MKPYNTQLTLMLMYFTDALCNQNFKVRTRKRKRTKEAVLPSRLETDNRTSLSFQMRCWIRVVPALTTKFTIFTLLYIHAYAIITRHVFMDNFEYCSFLCPVCFNAEASLSVSFFQLLMKVFPLAHIVGLQVPIIVL